MAGEWADLQQIGSHGAQIWRPSQGVRGQGARGGRTSEGEADLLESDTRPPGAPREAAEQSYATPGDGKSRKCPAL